MPMACKLDWVVTHDEGLPPIKLHDPLITQSSGIMWQTKTLYLHYHSAYRNQSCQVGELFWETHKSHIPIKSHDPLTDQVVLPNQVIN